MQIARNFAVARVLIDNSPAEHLEIMIESRQSELLFTALKMQLMVKVHSLTSPNGQLSPQTDQ